MILLLDIGNTSVTYGRYRGGRLHDFGSSLYGDIPKICEKWFDNGEKYKIDVILSSVVPQKKDYLTKFFSKIKGVKIWIVGENLPIRIKHRYHFPKKLGVDRAVNVYGAIRIYKPPLLMIDYGTAITFDYVSRKGIFEGGMIVPGPEISLQALIERAALLPKKIRLPLKAASFLGRNTYDCLSSGVLEGFGALTDGLIQRFRERYGKFTVVATGGFSKNLKPYTELLDVIDPKHSIKSLLLLFKDRR